MVEPLYGSSVKLSLQKEIPKHLRNSLSDFIFCRAVIIKGKQLEVELHSLWGLSFRVTKSNRYGYILKDIDISITMVAVACCLSEKQ